MILVDKNIKEYVDNGTLIEEGFRTENLNGVSYDLTMDVVCDEKGNENAIYELYPGETVFVKSREKLSIPANILGRVAEKNSRMRQGLKIDGPHYQPGHVTYAFLRVQNISTKIIKLQQGMNIAQIIFEQLNDIPDTPYNLQQNASFQNEVHYKGLGNYSQEYENQTRQKVEKTKQDIEEISDKIYANVLTIMGVFVAIFSLISINYQAFSQTDINFKFIIVMNFTLAICIAVLLGIILIFINKAKNKTFLWCYIAILAVLIVVTVLLGIGLF